MFPVMGNILNEGLFGKFLGLLLGKLLGLFLGRLLGLLLGFHHGHLLRLLLWLLGFFGFHPLELFVHFEAESLRNSFEELFAFFVKLSPFLDILFVILLLVIQSHPAVFLSQHEVSPQQNHRQPERH